MSLKRNCDKCGKPTENESVSQTDKMPDLLVAVSGETVLEYEDLCPLCKERVEANVDKYLAVKTRSRGEFIRE